MECGSSGARTDTLAGRSITVLTKPCHCVDLRGKSRPQPPFLRLTLTNWRMYGLARCLTMQAHFSHIPNSYRRWLFSFLIACLFIASLAPSFQSTTTRKKPKSPAYDCAGRIDHSSIEGNKLIDEAINEALRLLKKCDSCWRMFGDDPDYAINRLKKMKEDKAIIISSEAPVYDFHLSPDGKRLTVKTTQMLNDAAAATQDVADPKASAKSRDMVKPCMYINPNEFIVIDGKDAGRYALFNLPSATQRALAILHELGHVTRAIADDDDKTEKGRNLSVASTDCIRCNCIECEVFQCPGAPPRRHAKPRKKTKSSVAGAGGRARVRLSESGRKVP